MRTPAPGERALFDQALEYAIDRSVQGAALFDGMDTYEAMRAYAEAILKMSTLDVRDLAVAVAGLSIRLHRQERA